MAVFLDKMALEFDFFLLSILPGLEEKLTEAIPSLTTKCKHAVLSRGVEGGRIRYALAGLSLEPSLSSTHSVVFSVQNDSHSVFDCRKSSLPGISIQFLALHYCAASSEACRPLDNSCSKLPRSKNWIYNDQVKKKK